MALANDSHGRFAHGRKENKIAFSDHLGAGTGGTASGTVRPQCGAGRTGRGVFRCAVLRGGGHREGVDGGGEEPNVLPTQTGIIALLWLGRVLCHAFSTASSHKATFAVLGEIRKRCTEKLPRMSLGAVLSQSSGALKNTLIERFVKDAHAAVNAFIGRMRASIIPFTFAMVVMPATMVSVLPIGGLLLKDGTLSGQDFITVIILSVGLITPLITLMSYSDDFRTMGTIFGEVQAVRGAQNSRHRGDDAGAAARRIGRQRRHHHK